LRRLLDHHLALRALPEQRLERVTGEEGVIRTRVESGHARALETVFGTVSVERLAYRAPKIGNLHPADAALNLLVERHSHGLRKLAGVEAARGSFDDAVEAIERSTGQRLGKRQVEELATIAAMDFEDFYETRRPARGKRGDLLVLTADGKGVVMRPDALRTGTAKRAARAGPKPKVRLSREDQRHRKRMAEIGAVYDATAAPRTPAEIFASAAPDGHEPVPGPVATNKWVCASVVKDAGTVIERVFDEAERRDPKAPPHLGCARGRRQPPYPADQVPSQAAWRQGHDHLRLRARPPIPVERGGLPVDRRQSGRRAVGAPPDHPSARRTRHPSRGCYPPHRDQHRPRPRTPPSGRLGRQLPDEPCALPRLPYRPAKRLADRQRDRRRRLPPPHQGPTGHHRRRLGTRQRRSDPEATRPQSQR
jgi:hypothetical protein